MLGGAGIFMEERQPYAIILSDAVHPSAPLISDTADAKLASVRALSDTEENK
jgi:hypothetical protein